MALAYFQTLPKVYYDLTGGKPSRPIIATNILARARVLESIRSNSLIYYPYTVKDSDTPEIIAEKYYGSSGRHWIVLFANNIVDPFYDWVMSYNVFNKYIAAKYGDIPTAQATIDHYVKTISKTDSSSGLTNSTDYTIDELTYSFLPDTDTEAINLVNGTTVEIITTRSIVYAFDAEMTLNEAKRNIVLIDKKYAAQIEIELQDLMSA